MHRLATGPAERGAAGQLRAGEADEVGIAPAVVRTLDGLTDGLDHPSRLFLAGFLAGFQRRAGEGVSRDEVRGPTYPLPGGRVGRVTFRDTTRHARPPGRGYLLITPPPEGGSRPAYAGPRRSPAMNPANRVRVRPVVSYPSALRAAVVEAAPADRPEDPAWDLVRAIDDEADDTAVSPAFRAALGAYVRAKSAPPPVQFVHVEAPPDRDAPRPVEAGRRRWLVAIDVREDEIADGFELEGGALADDIAECHGVGTSAVDVAILAGPTDDEIRALQGYTPTPAGAPPREAAPAASKGGQ